MNQNTNKNQIPEEALQLLPWHAKNLLMGDDKAYMESALLKFPELQDKLKEELEIVRFLEEKKELYQLSSVGSAESRLENLHRSGEFTEKTIGTTETDQEASIFMRINNLINSLMSGSMSKTQYIGFAAISTLSIALLFAFVSPLVDKNNTFYPAYKGSVKGKSQADTTTLLLGLNIDPDDPRLLAIFKGYNAQTDEIPGKEGMYRMTFTKKPSAKELEKLVKELSDNEELIWFVGEAY